MAITFFVAIFTLDERRILDNRNSLAPCIVHQPTRFWAEPNIFHRGLHTIMAKGIMTKAGKTIVLMSTVCMTAFSLRGLLNLEQRFDPNWFIPSDTYLNRFTVEKRRLYPDQGYEAMIMMGRLNYTSELDKIRLMIQSVENRTDLVHEISNWLMPFHDFVQTYYRQDIFASNFNDTDFRKYLTKFLWSPSGGKYQANIRFEKKLECGKPSPNIAVCVWLFGVLPIVRIKSNQILAIPGLDYRVQIPEVSRSKWLCTGHAYNGRYRAWHQVEQRGWLFYRMGQGLWQLDNRWDYRQRTDTQPCHGPCVCDDLHNCADRWLANLLLDICLHSTDIGNTGNLDTSGDVDRKYSLFYDNSRWMFAAAWSIGVSPSI